MFDSNIGFPRVTGRFTLAADTSVTLKEFVDASLRASAQDLFVDETVANEAALEALVGKPEGYLVFKADNNTFWELIDPVQIADINVGWEERFTNADNGPLLSSLHRFLSNLSNKLHEGSFIANVDTVTTEPLYVLTWFAEPDDSIIQYTDAQVQAYGIKIEAGQERHYMGHLDPAKVILFCADDCEVALDLAYTA